jgi:hypothetical protein
VRLEPGVGRSGVQGHAASRPANMCRPLPSDTSTAAVLAGRGMLEGWFPPGTWSMCATDRGAGQGAPEDHYLSQ